MIGRTSSLSSTILVGLSRYILRPIFRLLAGISFSNTFTIPVRLKTGDVLLVRPLLMTDFLMATGLYETYTRKIFSPRPGETVIDVGAHIGFYTVQCARLVGKTGTVIAIEPDPRNFTLLMRNIRLNRLSNVIALNLALGAINGFVSFSLCQDPGSSQVSDSGRIQVKVRRLDDVLMELKIKKIDWIKIDVEGYEMEVLKGAINTLKHNRKLRLIIEVHSGDVLSFMQQLGFSESKLSYNIFGLFGNYFFRRKDGQYQLNET